MIANALRTMGAALIGAAILVFLLVTLIGFSVAACFVSAQTIARWLHEEYTEDEYR